MVVSLIQFKCTKYFRDDLTLVFEDAQCFNFIKFNAHLTFARIVYILCLLELLDHIADMLGTKWPRLARKLDLSTKVDSIKGDYRGDTHEQAITMLTKWKQKHGSNAKIKVIIEALTELELNDIADCILGACRAKENCTNI